MLENGHHDALGATVHADGVNFALWSGSAEAVELCLFDEQGRFIEGYYIVGLLAEAFLEKHPGAKIVHDPRLTWNTIAVAHEAGGVPIMNKTGHAFMKERMRAEDAVYGGEMSAHHYFRPFAYCDSGMLPWLWVWREMSAAGQPLSTLVADMQKAFPASGEIKDWLQEDFVTKPVNREELLTKVRRYLLR